MLLKNTLSFTPCAPFLAITINYLRCQGILSVRPFAANHWTVSTMHSFIPKLTNQTTTLFKKVRAKSLGTDPQSAGSCLMWFLAVLTFYNGRAKKVGTTAVSEAGMTSENEALKKLHNHDLPRTEGTDFVFVHRNVVANSVKDPSYPFPVHTINKVQAFLDNIFSSRLYGWDSQSMLPISTVSGSSQGQHGGHTSSGDEINEVEHPAVPVILIGRWQFEILT